MPYSNTLSPDRYHSDAVPEFASEAAQQRWKESMLDEWEDAHKRSDLRYASDIQARAFASQPRLTYGQVLAAAYGIVRTFYGPAAKVQAGAKGLASARSKTGDPKCSKAVSDWKTHKATPETWKQLAACRAMSRAGGQARALRGAGQEAKAQHLEHRLATGQPLTKAERTAKAKELLEKRKQEQSVVAPLQPTPGEPVAGEPEQPAQPGPRRFRKPPPKTPEEIVAREATIDALQAKERLNRAIQEYGQGSADEISAHREFKGKRKLAARAMKEAGQKPLGRKPATFAGLPGESEGLRTDAAADEASDKAEHQRMFDRGQELGREIRKHQWADPLRASQSREELTKLGAEAKRRGFDLGTDPSKLVAPGAGEQDEEAKHMAAGRRMGLSGSELDAYVHSQMGKGQIPKVIEQTKPPEKPKGVGGFFETTRSPTEAITGRVEPPKKGGEDMRRGAEEIAKAKATIHPAPTSEDIAKGAKNAGISPEEYARHIEIDRRGAAKTARIMRTGATTPEEIGKTTEERLTSGVKAARQKLAEMRAARAAQMGRKQEEVRGEPATEKSPKEARLERLGAKVPEIKKALGEARQGAVPEVKKRLAEMRAAREERKANADGGEKAHPADIGQRQSRGTGHNPKQTPEEHAAWKKWMAERTAEEKEAYARRHPPAPTKEELKARRKETKARMAAEDKAREAYTKRMSRAIAAEPEGKHGPVDEGVMSYRRRERAKEAVKKLAEARVARAERKAAKSEPKPRPKDVDDPEAEKRQLTEKHAEQQKEIDKDLGREKRSSFEEEHKAAKKALKEAREAYNKVYFDKNASPEARAEAHKIRQHAEFRAKEADRKRKQKIVEQPAEQQQHERREPAGPIKSREELMGDREEAMRAQREQAKAEQEARSKKESEAASAREKVREARRGAAERRGHIPQAELEREGVARRLKATPKESRKAKLEQIESEQPTPSLRYGKGGPGTPLHGMSKDFTRRAAEIRARKAEREQPKSEADAAKRFEEFKARRQAQQGGKESKPAPSLAGGKTGAGIKSAQQKFRERAEKIKPHREDIKNRAGLLRDLTAAPEEATKGDRGGWAEDRRKSARMIDKDLARQGVKMPPIEEQEAARREFQRRRAAAGQKNVRGQLGTWEQGKPKPAGEPAKPAEDQPSAARQRTAARLAAQKGAGQGAQPAQPAPEQAKKSAAKPAAPARPVPAKPEPFPTEGPFAPSPSRGDRPRPAGGPAPGSVKPTEPTYDPHGRERAIVRGIQKLHGSEPVDDRGMMIERIIKESGLPHDEGWRTLMEMHKHGSIDFDPLGDTEAELSRQYGAKTYQPPHLGGKHANVARLLNPRKLNVPLEQAGQGRTQYAMAMRLLRSFL